MRRQWSGVLLALPLLLQLAEVTSGLPARWPGFTSHHNFKPFKPKRARFAAPLQGFSNIFQNNGINRWSSGGFPSMHSTAWSEYPAASQTRLQQIPLAHNYYHRYTAPPPSTVPPPPAPTRRHRFVPASNIQRGKVPTHFMTDAELHGLVCVPASSLASALADHRDQVEHHRDGSVTTHRTVLAGTDGTTSHSTRISSATDGSTVVETRTNSTSGVQKHRQSVQDTGAGVVRTSTGSAFAEGRPGLPTHADVITSSSSEGSNSQSRASASGYDITGKPLPARSVSQSVSRGVGGRTVTQSSNSGRGSQPPRPAPAPAQLGGKSAAFDPRAGPGDSSASDQGDVTLTERSGGVPGGAGGEEGPGSSEEATEVEEEDLESGSEGNGSSEAKENLSDSDSPKAMGSEGDTPSSPSNDEPASTSGVRTPQGDEEAPDDGDDSEEGDASSAEDTTERTGDSGKPETGDIKEIADERGDDEDEEQR